MELTPEVSASVMMAKRLRISLEKSLGKHSLAKCWNASFWMGGEGVRGRAVREAFRDWVGERKIFSSGASMPE